MGGDFSFGVIKFLMKFLGYLESSPLENNNFFVINLRKKLRFQPKKNRLRINILEKFFIRINLTPLKKKTLILFYLFTHMT